MAITIDSIFTCSQLTVKNSVVETKNRGFGIFVSYPRKFSTQFVGNKGNVKVRASVGSIMQEVENLEGILGIDVVSEGELKNKGFLGMRKTKLVCTIGPSCCSSEDLEKLALGGMNVARLNMCHGTREWHCDVIRKIKWLNQEKGFCVSVMIDTEGSQIHVVDHGSPSSVKAEEGSTWLFTTNKFEGSGPFIAQASDEGFSEGIVVGDGLVIDGGMASFEVTEKIGNDLRCKCTDSGIFLPRAKMSFWRDGRLVQKKNEHPTISTKDWADIEYGISEGVDFIALSFVNDANSVKHLKNYLITKSSNPIRVLAKIESLESLSKLEAIIEASDGIMVARGDLGVEIPLEQIPSVQELITKTGRQLNKPVIVASQLLESMIEFPIPTRAEVADVSEAVRQYADALMLSGESAIGLHGEKALSVLRMASSRMELWSREENRQRALRQHELATSLPEKIAEQICNGAAEMANNLGVDAIFVYTEHGQIASLMSRNRPNSPIFAFTNENSTRMALTLQWGVTPVLIDLSDDMEANIMKTVDFTKTQGIVKKGDTVLVVSDIIPTRASSNLFQSIQVKIVA